MSEPQASVVIPSYNHGRFVAAAVESVLDQDADLELVVVDDGSTDDSRERLAAFAGDPRVRIFEQPNRGAHAALNRGLGLARGEVLFILNSDDLFEPGRVGRFLERFAADPGIAVLVSWLRVIDEDGGELGVKEAWRNLPPWPRPGSGPGLADTGDPTLALLESNYVATTSNVAFRRQLVAEVGLRFRHLRYTHDWDFLLAAAEHGGIAIVDQPLVRYRAHQRNTIGEGRDGGMGRMRFEILWTVARYARPVCRRFAARGMDPADLRRRLWSSLPRFGCANVLAQLLVLRGDGEEALAAYDALLEEEHPYRRRAVAVLAQTGAER